MNGTRLIVWIVGLALVVAAAFLLFFETGLSRYVPAGIAIAGLVLIVGVAIMSMADRMPRDQVRRGPEHVDREVRPEKPPRREEHIYER